MMSPRRGVVEVVRDLDDQDAVARHQRGLHRARRDVEGLEQEGLDQQRQDERHQDEARQFPHELEDGVAGLLLRAWSSGSGASSDVPLGRGLHPARVPGGRGPRCSLRRAAAAPARRPCTMPRPRRPRAGPGGSTEPSVTSATTGGANATRTRARSPSIETASIGPCRTLRAEPPSGREVCSTTSAGRSVAVTSSAGVRARPAGHATISSPLRGDQASGALAPAARAGRCRGSLRRGRPRRTMRGASRSSGGRAGLGDARPSSSITAGRRASSPRRDRGSPARALRGRRRGCSAGADGGPRARATSKRRGGLVQQQEVRLVDQGSCQGHALRLAAGEIGRARVVGRRGGQAFRGVPALRGCEPSPLACPRPAAGTRRSPPRTGAGTAAGPGRRRRRAVARPGMAGGRRRPVRPRRRRSVQAREGSHDRRLARRRWDPAAPPSVRPRRRGHASRVNASRGPDRRVQAHRVHNRSRSSDEHHQAEHHEQERQQDGARPDPSGVPGRRRAAGSACARRGSRRT